MSAAIKMAEPPQMSPSVVRNECMRTLSPSSDGRSIQTRLSFLHISKRQKNTLTAQKTSGFCEDQAGSILHMNASKLLAVQAAKQRKEQSTERLAEYERRLTDEMLSSDDTAFCSDMAALHRRRIEQAEAAIEQGEYSDSQEPVAIRTAS